MLPRPRYRPLNAAERALVEYLLRDDEPGYGALRAQVPTALRVAPWYPGSQCFDIEVNGDVPLYRDDSTRAGEMGNLVGAHGVYRAGALPSEATHIGDIFLWVREGRLAALEYASTAEIAPDVLPSTEQLFT
jgi:hypothetical protein